VVCPLEDPDPRVSGRGFAALRAAGVAIETGLMATEARRLNAGFLSRVERGRPWLTLKLATTLDGRIATRHGESRWISCPQARLHAHLLRAQSDAILVGAGTTRADDPMLDVRGLGPQAAHPVRVVADSGLSLAPGGRLAASARQIPVWAMHGPDAPAERREALKAQGVVTMAVRARPGGGLDLADVMARLGEAGINAILCEGGGQMAASLLRAGLVDEVALVNAGIAIGGDGIPVVGPLGLDRLADAPGFVLESFETVGVDVLSVWVARPAGHGNEAFPPYPGPR
jgi:diaminohydroxyphosphoribosylaminopyrimidine deaminase/5-amino-6-(5-phosphoribosylamino)uracil reductase